MTIEDDDERPPRKKFRVVKGPPKPTEAIKQAANVFASSERISEIINQLGSGLGLSPNTNRQHITLNQSVIELNVSPPPKDPTPVHFSRRGQGKKRGRW